LKEPVNLAQLRDENRYLRAELDALRAEKFARRSLRIRAAACDDLVTSEEVMAFFGYKSRPAFWTFVHSAAVPQIKLNARRIMFDPVALNRWLERRDTSGQARKFTFRSDSNHELPAA
jgi:predicted DNA-binding transcriptional regulator AlpA